MADGHYYKVVKEDPKFEEIYVSFVLFLLTYFFNGNILFRNTTRKLDFVQFLNQEKHKSDKWKEKWV